MSVRLMSMWPDSQITQAMTLRKCKRYRIGFLQGLSCAGAITNEQFDVHAAIFCDRSLLRKKAANTPPTTPPCGSCAGRRLRR